MHPVFSTVIPTFNEEKYLPKCLVSLSRQSFQDFEIIIVDGGSSDQTVEIARKYKRLIKQNISIFVVKDSNVVIARDKGMRMANGEIIVGIDADTIYPGNYLKNIAGAFQHYHDTIAVVGPGKLSQAPLWATLFWQATYTVIKLIYRCIGFIMYAPAFNLSYRKDVFLAKGGYDTTLDFGGDELDVLERLKTYGKVMYLPNIEPITSGRRYQVGMFRFFFQHAFYYYWLNYILRKYFGKRVIRAKPVR